MGTFVLLVEQDEDVRKLLVTYLTREGFAVLCAQNPRDSVRVAAEYDKLVAVVIIEDLYARDSVSVLPHLRAHNPAMRVIVTGAYSDDLPPDVVHLPKPFHLPALRRHLLAMFDD